VARAEEIETACVCVLWGVLSRFENKIMEMRKRRSGRGSEVGNSEKKIKPRTSEERERKR